MVDGSISISIWEKRINAYCFYTDSSSTDSDDARSEVKKVKMAGAVTERDHSSAACSDDPNFATICSFIEKFGESCHIGLVPFDELQRMLENTTESKNRKA